LRGNGFLRVSCSQFASAFSSLSRHTAHASGLGSGIDEGSFISSVALDIGDF
jgi:hypothetical protein